MEDLLWQTFPLDYLTPIEQIPENFNLTDTYILFDTNSNERTLGKFVCFNSENNTILFLDTIWQAPLILPINSYNIYKLSYITDIIQERTGLNKDVQNNTASFLGGKKSRKSRKSRKSKKSRKARK